MQLITAILKVMAMMAVIYLLATKVFQPWFTAHMIDGVSKLQTLNPPKVEQKK
jgi:hypothetical protein